MADQSLEDDGRAFVVGREVDDAKGVGVFDKDFGGQFEELVHVARVPCEFRQQGLERVRRRWVGVDHLFEERDEGVALRCVKNGTLIAIVVHGEDRKSHELGKAVLRVGGDHSEMAGHLAHVVMRGPAFVREAGRDECRGGVVWELCFPAETD